MARRRRQSEGSLDSLLDTMTNVVGILVILLTVTQLSVSEAVERVLRTEADMQKTAEVTAAQLTEAKKRAVELDEELTQTSDRVTEMLAASKEVDEQAAAQREAIDDLNRQIEVITQSANDTDKAQAALDAQKKELADTQAAMQRLSAELKSAEQQLEQTPRPAPPPPKVVKLPNPRPAPKGAQPLYFLCKGDRVIPVPLEGLQRLAQARLRAIINNPNAKGEVDCDKMVALFKQTSVGNDSLALSIYVSNFRPYLTVEARPGAGEPTETIRDGTSRFRVNIFRANPDTHYARFLVWPDSFEAYLAARNICDERGLPAGWVPFYDNQQWRTSLGLTLTCEGKPPPPPPDPNRKPPVKPATPPRTLPADTVD